MLTIQIHYVDGIASLDMNGKFIKGQGGFQLQMLIDRVMLAGTSQLILNLTDVPIIDSMGIGEIVRAYKKVKDANGELKLVGLTDRVYGALKITQLLDLIQSYRTEEEAAATFKSEAEAQAQAQSKPETEPEKKPRGRKKKAESSKEESKEES